MTKVGGGVSCSAAQVMNLCDTSSNVSCVALTSTLSCTRPCTTLKVAKVRRARLGAPHEDAFDKLIVGDLFRALEHDRRRTRLTLDVATTAGEAVQQNEQPMPE